MILAVLKMIDMEVARAQSIFDNKAKLIAESLLPTLVASYMDIHCPTLKKLLKQYELTPM